MKVLNTTYRGEIAEHIAVADLINRGYEVYKSVTHSGSVDLIIKKHYHILTVEVRRATVTKNGYFNCNKNNKANILALVDHDKNVYYFKGNHKRNRYK